LIVIGSHTIVTGGVALMTIKWHEVNDN